MAVRRASTVVSDYVSTYASEPVRSPSALCSSRFMTRVRHILTDRFGISYERLLRKLKGLLPYDEEQAPKGGPNLEPNL